jgi:hypothetical protein
MYTRTYPKNKTKDGEHLGDRVWYAECRWCREGRPSGAKFVVGRAMGMIAYVTGMAARPLGVKATGKVVTTKGEELVKGC